MARKKRNIATIGTELGVVNDYLNSCLTVKEIAAKHYIAVRTVYNILDRHGHCRDITHIRRKNLETYDEDYETVSLRLQRIEIELILLLFLESEDILTDSYKVTADLLIDKLLKKVEVLENKYA